VCHRECENNALFMKGKDLNFNSQEEEECVETIFSQAMECLKEEDRSLNFIETLLPLLKRGIGVHHSGLLPILKEVIELLFQEQLIKVNLQLFCFYRWLFSVCQMVPAVPSADVPAVPSADAHVLCASKAACCCSFCAAARPNEVSRILTGAACLEQAAPEEATVLRLTYAHVVVLRRQVFASFCTFSESTWSCCIAVCSTCKLTSWKPNCQLLLPTHK